MKGNTTTKILSVIIMVVSLGLVLSACAGKTANDNTNGFTAAEVVSGAADVKIKEKADKDLAVAKAQELYRAALYNGDDLSNGPCLSNKVIDDWVADIAHDPRQDVDNLPENQCSAYRDGTAKHFVELDTDGNLIRAE